MTIGGATMYTVNTDTSTSLIYGYSILLGAGTGIVFNLGFTVASITMMQQTGSGLDVQRVSSMQNLSQLGWQLISLLIGGQIMQEVSFRNLSKVLDGLGFSDEEIRQAAAGASSTLFDSLAPSVREQAIQGIADAIKDIYILSIISGAAMIVVVVFLPKGRLFPKEEKTDEVAVA
jgi:hypothetical protein